MLYQTAIRHLVRQKTYTLLNAIGLATGLVCMLLAVLYWKDEHSFNHFHEKSAQLYRITTTVTDRETGRLVRSGGTRQAHGPAFRAAIPELEAVTRLLGGDIKGDIRHEDRALKLQMLFADDNFFQSFTFPLLQGDPNSCLKELNSIVLSEEAALKFFGTTNALGRLLHLDADPSAEKLGKQPMIVTGVAKSLPPQSSIQFEALLPMRFMQLSFEDKTWVGGYLGTFVVLSNGADIQGITQKMDDIFYQNASAEIQDAGYDPKIKHGLQNIADVHLEPLDGVENAWNECGVVNGSRPIYAQLFLGIAFFILLLASINFVNISIATSLSRAKEVGIRKLNGSSRSSIFGQFLGESALLCGMAYALALFGLFMVLPVFNVLADKKISLSGAIDWKLLTGFALVFFINVSLAGIYPAWQLSAFKPVETLYNRSRPARQLLLGKILVVVQFSLAFLLAVATTVFYAQMRFVQNKDLGYEAAYVIRTNINGDQDYEPIRQFLKNETARHSCFEGISFGCEFGNTRKESVLHNGQTVNAVYQSVDPNFLPLMNIALRSGHHFSAPNSREVLVNETFVRDAGLQNPIGATVKIHPDYSDGPMPYTIVGVVADFHFESLHKPIQPLALYQQNWRNSGIWLKINREKSAEGLATFEKIYRQAMPGSVYEYQFISDLNAREYAREQRWQSMVGIAAVLALLICGLGLFGLSHLNAVQRTKEIGIRKTLGASVAGITRLLTKDFLTLVLLAILIASPLACYVMQKWLSNFAYRVDLQWWMFVGAGALALLVAFLTVGAQSVRAALANPAHSLKSE